MTKADAKEFRIHRTTVQIQLRK